MLDKVDCRAKNMTMDKEINDKVVNSSRRHNNIEHLCT